MGDLLAEKIKKFHVVDFFPDYDGPKEDGVPAREVFLQKFLAVNPDAERGVYSHFTTAIDTENIKVVFCAVKDTIMQKALAKWVSHEMCFASTGWMVDCGWSKKVCASHVLTSLLFIIARV